MSKRYIADALATGALLAASDMNDDGNPDIAVRLGSLRQDMFLYRNSTSGFSLETAWAISCFLRAEFWQEN